MVKIRIVSRVLPLLVIVLLFLSCIKENGKKAYILSLQFNSGDKYFDERLIEEEKKELIINKSNGEQLILYKVNNEKLTGLGGILMNASNFNFLNNENGNLAGLLEMEGEYKQLFRKYEVDNGTFKFKWNNAEAFGMNDTILKGTWTLKRK